MRRAPKLVLKINYARRQGGTVDSGLVRKSRRFRPLKAPKHRNLQPQPPQSCPKSGRFDRVHGQQAEHARPDPLLEDQHEQAVGGADREQVEHDRGARRHH
jgi:hypothetical protein